MKKAVVLVLTFAVGVASGVLAHRSLAKSQPTQPSSTASPTANPLTDQQWTETEEKTRERMRGFQDRLDKLQPPPTSDSVERIAKEMELQRGIDDILIKYREAQQSKFTLLSARGHPWRRRPVARWPRPPDRSRRLRRSLAAAGRPASPTTPPTHPIVAAVTGGTRNRPTTREGQQRMARFILEVEQPRQHFQGTVGVAPLESSPGTIAIDGPDDYGHHYERDRELDETNRHGSTVCAFRMSDANRWTE
jgi:hypothetical protein